MQATTTTCVTTEEATRTTTRTTVSFRIASESRPTGLERGDEAWELEAEAERG